MNQRAAFQHSRLHAILAVAICTVWAFSASSHGGGLDANGGHTDRSTDEYHSHRKGSAEGRASGCGERPRHNPTLDVDWARENGRVAPYTCRNYASARDVDIEHIVAWAEARRSGLSCSDADRFVNDPLNITVAYPRLNRQQKSDKDIADWQPPKNACWFAERVRAVKAKYGLAMDERERRALDAVLAGCSAEQRRTWQCP